MSSSTSSASNKGLYPSLFLYAGVANREFHSPQQVDYIARSESAIQEAITEMRVGDPRGLFGRVLHMLGEHRHQTAVAHATADAGSFGWRRDRSHGYCMNTMFRSSMVKSAYNPSALAIARNMSFKIASLEEPILTEIDALTPHLPPVQLRIQRLRKDLAPQLSLSPEEDLESIDYRGDPTSFGRGLMAMASLKELEATEPYKYAQRALIGGRQALCNSEGYFAVAEGQLLAASLKVSLGAEEIPLTNYLSCLPRASQGREHYIQKAPICLAHTDSVYVGKLMPLLADGFNAVVQWDRKDPALLRESMVRFLYLFAHVMPFERGSASVGEWLETALFAFHGLRIVRRRDVIVDLMAFESILPTAFACEYNKLTHLETAPELLEALRPTKTSIAFVKVLDLIELACLGQEEAVYKHFEAATSDLQEGYLAVLPYLIYMKKGELLIKLMSLEPLAANLSPALWFWDLLLKEVLAHGLGASSAISDA